jgi:hypothetical protein
MDLRDIREAATVKANGEQQVFGPPKPAPTLDDVVMPISDFRALNIPARKHFLSPWLNKATIILVSGGRGDGKTFFGISAVEALKPGGVFGPWKSQNPARSCFVDGELPPADIIDRTKLLGLSNPDLFIYSDAYATTIGFPRACLCDPDWRNEIKAFLVDKKFEIVVFDNIASLAPGLDENSRKDWDPINQFLLDLRFAGITSILLHHTGKNGMQRGTSAREDNLDVSILLSRPPTYHTEDGARFICSFTKARVAHKDLHLIQDIEFQLAPDESGNYVWTYAPVKNQARKVVLEMLDQGVKQNDVASALGVSKGQVSKIRAKAIKDGLLSAKNKLTMDGFQAIQGETFK